MIELAFRVTRIGHSVEVAFVAAEAGRRIPAELAIDMALLATDLTVSAFQNEARGIMIKGCRSPRIH